MVESAQQLVSDLAPVSVREIATVIAVLADEYEAYNARARRSLVRRFWLEFPELRELKLRKVVTYLGWRVIAGTAKRPGRGG